MCVLERDRERGGERERGAVLISLTQHSPTKDIKPSDIRQMIHTHMHIDHFSHDSIGEREREREGLFLQDFFKCMHTDPTSYKLLT